jgi:hypothetical protein
MTRRRPVFCVSAAVALAAAGFGQVGSPAGATVNSCAMTEYPAKIFSYSGLKVACSSSGAGPASSAIAIHDFSNAVWHPGASRTIVASTTTASPTITSATGFLSALAGDAGDINRAISGPGIPAGTWIKAVAGTTATLSANATLTAPAASLMIENSTGRTFKDGHTTALSTTVTSASAGFTASDANQVIGGNGLKPGTKVATVVNSTTITITPAATKTLATAQLTVGDATTSIVRAINDGHTTALSTTVTSATAKFVAADAGTGIGGPGIPLGTYIKTVTSPTAIVLTKNATATSLVAKLVIGAKTASAPTNGDHVSQLTGELNLNPAFIPTLDDCAENTPEGYALSGDWYNPGSFIGTGAYPANTIAQILYTTSVLSFSAYVSYVATDVAIATPHFDVTLPTLPIGIVACTGSPSTTTFTFNAIASSQEKAAGTPIVRAIGDVAGPGPVTATGKVVAGSPAVTYTTTCSIGRQISAPAFSCGNATVGLAG